MAIRKGLSKVVSDAEKKKEEKAPELASPMGTPSLLNSFMATREVTYKAVVADPVEINGIMITPSIRRKKVSKGDLILISFGYSQKDIESEIASAKTLSQKEIFNKAMSNGSLSLELSLKSDVDEEIHQIETFDTLLQYISYFFPDNSDEVVSTILTSWTEEYNEVSKISEKKIEQISVKR